MNSSKTALFYPRTQHSAVNYFFKAVPCFKEKKKTNTTKQQSKRETAPFSIFPSSPPKKQWIRRGSTIGTKPHYSPRQTQTTSLESSARSTAYQGVVSPHLNTPTHGSGLGGGGHKLCGITPSKSRKKNNVEPTACLPYLFFLWFHTRH